MLTHPSPLTDSVKRRHALLKSAFSPGQNHTEEVLLVILNLRCGFDVTAPGRLKPDNEKKAGNGLGNEKAALEGTLSTLLK